MRLLPPALALLLAAACVSPLSAENWPQWRGPRHDGTSTETGLPVSWNRTQNIAWRLRMPGPAGATPVVWDDRIFLTSVDSSGDLLLLCIGTDGEKKWSQVVGSGNKDVRGDEGNSAAPSPSTDGKHVWTFMANGQLACYTVDGEKVWGFNVQDRYGKLSIAFGMTSTPVLHEGVLYLQLIHGEGNPSTREARVVALNAADGEEKWAVERPSDAKAECEHSYASPTLYVNGDQKFLISHGADYTVGHSLEDGSELWRVGDLNPKGKYNPTLRFVSSPLAVENLIVIPSAKSGPVFGLLPGAEGDVTESAEAFQWKYPRNTPDVSSPLVVDGLCYLVRENGNLLVLDAKTGEEVYEERTTADSDCASHVYADGKIYTTARRGIVSVVKAGRTFELLSQNELDEEMSASPVISGGRIYLRTFENLYAVGAAAAE